MDIEWVNKRKRDESCLAEENGDECIDEELKTITEKIKRCRHEFWKNWKF